jgi:hypothetical protein
MNAEIMSWKACVPGDFSRTPVPIVCVMRHRIIDLSDLFEGGE